MAAARINYVVDHERRLSRGLVTLLVAQGLSGCPGWTALIHSYASCKGLSQTSLHCVRSHSCGLGSPIKSADRLCDQSFRQRSKYAFFHWFKQLMEIIYAVNMMTACMTINLYSSLFHTMHNHMYQLYIHHTHYCPVCYTSISCPECFI